jgi:hypothetical protein
MMAFCHFLARSVRYPAVLALLRIAPPGRQDSVEMPWHQAPPIVLKNPMRLTMCILSWGVSAFSPGGQSYEAATSATPLLVGWVLVM